MPALPHQDPPDPDGTRAEPQERQGRQRRGRGDGEPGREWADLLVSSAQDHAIFMLDPQGTVLTWNPGVERILGFREHEWVGQHTSLAFTPEDRESGEPDKEMERAAREGRTADVRWHMRKDGSLVWAEGGVTALRDGAGTLLGFGKVMADATKRKLAEDALRTSEATLRSSEERYRTLIESMDVGFCVLQLIFDERGRAVDYRYVEANAAFERHTGLVDALGRTVRELVPDLDAFWFEAYGRVALTGEPTRFESHAPAMGRWFDVYALRVGAPEERRVGVLFTDVTERKRAEDALRDAEGRERARLTDIFMQAPAIMGTMRGPDHVLEVANPPFFRLVGKGRDVLGRPIAEGLPELVEQGLVGLLDRVYRTGEPFAGSGVSVLLQRTPGGPPEERFLDFTYQPLRDADGRITGVLSHGIDLTERRRLEQERERLFIEQRTRAEREALVNQIGAAVRAAMEPEEVLSVAVEALGRALSADRCYYVTYDLDRDRGRIAPDWHREGVGLTSIAGEYRMSDYAVNREAGYRRGGTQVVDDVHEHAASSPVAADAPPVTLMDHLGLRSLIRAPLLSGGVMTVLAVAMSGGPRRWTEDEVWLVETVAAQTRAAVEAARVQQRERNIAQQLQDALQPPPPADLPGLALQGFYRPALAEAGVGGDFYDVFPVAKGYTALVVGDLSGKGLAAASEVATVRNMVRYALYSGSPLAQAITSLDGILVEHGLLTGFATLFVGVYDHDRRTLTYVNCGQEPGLLLRVATGRTEELGATGRVLGSFAGWDFTEATVALTPGDVVAIFTDGLTDVRAGAGADRNSLLGAQGVAQILKGCGVADDPRPGDARTLLECLIAGADAFGQGAAAGDDIALLIGVAGPGDEADRG